MEPLYQDDKVRIDYLTKSQIFSYDYCPMQFYNNYIRKIRQPENLAMQIGTRIHKFTEQFMEVCETLPVEQWKKTIPDEFIPLERELAENIISFETARYNKYAIDETPELFAPFATELWVSSDNLRIRGNIDRIDWVDPTNKKVSIVEIKTGKPKESKVIQELAFYKMLFEDQHPEYEVVEYGIYAPNTEEFNFFTPKEREKKLVIKKWDALKQALAKNRFSAPYNEYKCDRCSYCEVCHGKREAIQ